MTVHEESHSEPQEGTGRGVMAAGYARGREERPHLRFRYRSRALLAVRSYLEVRGQETPGRDGQGGHRVLDLGAAEGRTLVEMARLLGGEGTFEGVDLSEELLAAAPELPPGVSLRRGDVTALPPDVEDGAYTLVTALAVLEHLPRPQDCLAEAFRKLAPGGVFVATCPSPVWDRVAGRLGMVADEHHEQHLDLSRLEELARDAGFEVAAARRFMWAPVGFLPYLRLPVSPGFADAVDRAVGRLRVFDFLFVNQAMVARKPGSDR